MSAAVEPRGNRKFLAWCDKCQDGYGGSKKAAQNWADQHNAERHAEESK